jgi:hypothetical protein
MTQPSKFPNSLIILAFFADLLTPILIWKGIVPGGFRWISHGAIALMIALTPFRMIVFNRIPASFWIIVLLSIVGSFVAIFSGQGFMPTIWGWWLMFQYPLICLFSYLQPVWPKYFSKTILSIILATLILQVLVQFGQYISGEIPGDNLAGTFGEKGTGNLVLFLNLSLCFAIGDWLENSRWTYLAPTLLLGFTASILGEMKFFPIVLGILVFIASILYTIRSRRIIRVLPYTVLMSLFVVGFIPVYNFFVPSAREIPVHKYFQDQQLVEKYLNLSTRSTDARYTYFDLGRNYAAEYGWKQIIKDPLTLIFGYGIGARGESKTLGILGRALVEGNTGNTSGTSLLILMQETGLLGMLALLIFMVVVIRKLNNQIKNHPYSDANGLRYGLILFTLLWPFWIWYNTAWSLRIPMLIYWVILGYVLGNVAVNKVNEPAVSKLDTQY